MEKEITQITNFITETVKNAGFEKIIIGLSGGIDSSLVATLCCRALGCRNVIGVMLPYKSSNPESLEHATVLAQQLHIKHYVYPITDMVDAYFNQFEPQAEALRRGNLMARVRMCVLFDLSVKHHALVAGTTNLSELYVGYCTQYGDNACAFEPIAHLLKREVQGMALALNIPQPIIDKSPSADLWAGQTDEQELGISYETLDIILTFLLREKREKKYILQHGIAEQDYDLVIKKMRQSEFKRVLPPMMELVIDNG